MNGRACNSLKRIKKDALIRWIGTHHLYQLDNALKIDGEFVRSMRTHPADAAIVMALVRLARDLGMRSVAEWVEDLETLKALKEIGADYVQGYIFSKPQESAEILTVDSSASFISDPNVIHYLGPLYWTHDISVAQHKFGS
jgi:predicted signal transduction protein with EAL and GGDEF domain